MLIFNAIYRFINAQGQKETVPLGWYNIIAGMAPTLKDAGVTHVMLPSPCKTQSGDAYDADGYGKCDDYDFGDKNQSYSIGTRSGTADEARRCRAILHAHGIEVIETIVTHQYDGVDFEGSPASGGPHAGRFKKFLSCFSPSAPGQTIPPYCPPDPVYDNNGNDAFGNPTAVVHSLPQGYMWAELLKAVDYLLRTLGARGGMCIDDVKGQYAPFIKSLVTSMSMADKWKFGEYSDGQVENLEGWIGASPWSPMQGCCGLMDFNDHYNYRDALNGDAPMAKVLSGLFSRDPYHAVRFPDSADSDTTDGMQIMFSKLLAYYGMICGEGVTMIYARDFLALPYCYGMGDLITNAAWIGGHLANGPTANRWGDSNVAVFERLGPPGLLVCLNKDPMSAHTVTVQTNFGPNRWLHDFTGHYPDCSTDEHGNLTVTLHSNTGQKGQNVGCFAPAFCALNEIQYGPTNTVQEWDSSDESGDMVVTISKSGATTSCGMIWAAKGTTATLTVTSSHGIAFRPVLINATKAAPAEVLPTSPGKFKIPADGWYQVQVARTADGLPDASFILRADYTAPQTAKLVDVPAGMAVTA